LSITVSEDAAQLPVFNAVAGRVPLMLFMPTRREAPDAWRAIWQTHQKSRSSVLLVLDKTHSGNATRFFTHQVNQNSDAGEVFLIRRPFDEDPMRSMSDLGITNSLFVMQLHDDDEWIGYPVLPSRPFEYLSFEVRCTRVSCSQEALLDGLVSRFYGAVRGDIWTRFMGHFGRKHWGRNETLDQTFSFLLSALGNSGVVENYEYVYNDHNWSTWERALQNSATSMRSLGWNVRDPWPAVHWSHLLDDIEALDLFHDMMLQGDEGRVVKQRLRFPLEPVGERRLDALVWNVLPPAVRASVVRSRGAGRGLKRLATTALGIPRLLQSPTETTLLGGRGRISLLQIRDLYIPALSSWATPPLHQQFAAWTQAVEDLNARQENPTAHRDGEDSTPRAWGPARMMRPGDRR
jgi:hypothetical protein